MCEIVNVCVCICVFACVCTRSHARRSELRFVMSNINCQLTSEELEDLLNDADHNNDGFITYDGLSPFARCHPC